MNPQVKKQWLDALRSGEYAQGQHALRVQDKFCCLGVLCDIHSKETGRAWKPDVTAVRTGQMVYGYGVTYLPTEVRDWSGLDKHDPTLPPESLTELNECLRPEDSITNPHYTLTLSKLNDRDYSFEFIANVIEKYL